MAIETYSGTTTVKDAIKTNLVNDLTELFAAVVALQGVAGFDTLNPYDFSTVSDVVYKDVMNSTIVAADTELSADLCRGSRMIQNTGATGEVIVTLPTYITTDGLIMWAYVTVAQYLQIKAAGTNKIRHAGDLSAEGGYIRANTIGNCVCLYLPASGTQWRTLSIVGTWTMDS